MRDALKKELLKIVQEFRTSQKVPEDLLKAWEHHITTSKSVLDLHWRISKALILISDNTLKTNYNFNLSKMLERFLAIVEKEAKMRKMYLKINDQAFWPAIYIDDSKWCAELRGEFEDSPLLLAWADTPHEALQKIYDTPVSKIMDTYREKKGVEAETVQWISL